MKFFSLTQDHGEDQTDGFENLYISRIDLSTIDHWDLKSGKYIEKWPSDIIGFHKQATELTDFPITAYDIPIFSSRLRILMNSLGVEHIQYLPIQIREIESNFAIDNYFIANYLLVIDALDIELSDYQVWTKENLLFWEEREWMLNTFRDVKKVVLSKEKIKNEKLFRIKSWNVATIIREDIKLAIENAKITGCLFSEVEVA